MNMGGFSHVWLPESSGFVSLCQPWQRSRSASTTHAKSSRSTMVQANLIPQPANQKWPIYIHDWCNIFIQYLYPYIDTHVYILYYIYIHIYIDLFVVLSLSTWSTWHFFHPSSQFFQVETVVYVGEGKGNYSKEEVQPVSASVVFVAPGANFWVIPKYHELQ